MSHFYLMMLKFIGYVWISLHIKQMDMITKLLQNVDIINLLQQKMRWIINHEWILLSVVDSEKFFNNRSTIKKKLKNSV